MNLDAPIGSTVTGRWLEGWYGRDLFSVLASRKPLPDWVEEGGKSATWSRLDEKPLADATPEENREATFIRTA